MRNKAWMLVAVTLGGLTACAGTPTRNATSKPLVYATYWDEVARSEHAGGARTQANLDQIKRALEVPETRMTALRGLLDYAGLATYLGSGVAAAYYLNDTGELREQAARAAHGAADEGTILKALNAPDPMLTYWGTSHFDGLKNANAALPIVRRLAQGKDETLRVRAVEVLLRNGEREFVGQLAATEKSPEVLDEILFAGNPNGARAMNARLEELLKDPEPGVRAKVLGYIKNNWMKAAARQLYVDAPLMDAVLACAQEQHPEAAYALETFRANANQEQLANVAAAESWWNEKRSNWELGRFPRWVRPAGMPIKVSIVTTGQIGGTPEWQASITLENHWDMGVWVTLAKTAELRWDLFDRFGQRVPLETKYGEAVPNWLEMQPGQTVTQVWPELREVGPLLKPGRYMLHASVILGMDRRGIPDHAAMYSGELALPTITIEVKEAGK